MNLVPKRFHPHFLFLLGVLLLAAVFLSLFLGVSRLDFVGIFNGTAPSDRLVLLHERLPRALLAMAVGTSLAAAGLAFQAVLNNPLADPYIVGVAGGAAVGGTFAMILPISAIFGQLGVSAMAFLGGLAAILMTWELSKDRLGQLRTYHVLLVGVVFNTFASAVIMFLKSVVKAEKAQEMLMWLMGTLSSDIRSPQAVGISLGIAALALLILYRLANGLNALAIGQEDAASLGVDPIRTTKGVFLAGSLLVASAVSVAGMIGFVGLIVPHAIRAMVGSDHRITIPASALLGALFLLLADLATRLMFPVFQTEAPVGVLTALIGGPLFVYLLRRSEGLS
ncbi:MAG TPA: iron ABC transporter permease [Myxococcota bacterium]|nr:iron ABC transporter permease [Myxococcota bacterium]HON24389.1 iron ABC transporter permease [Myxococcota bacterium]HPC91131.1 iron ABC transporter permease [Myxococcota bacterium]HRR73488.1 iron ABC transporter permease [Myxococcota bacterium]HRV16746.1 iron ABC transporter permease [Myxococcota bacterium]